MSCGGGGPAFRILDGLVGWDTTSFEGLEGARDPGGIRLASASGQLGLSPNAVWPYIPPPRLAYDCASCSWYLVTPAPPASRLLMLDTCTACGTRWSSPGWARDLGGEFVAVAIHTRLIAIANRERSEVMVFGRAGGVVGRWAVPSPTALAFASPRDLLVVSEDRRILRFDVAGPSLGDLPLELDTDARIVAIAATAEGAVWAVLSAPNGRRSLRRRDCDGVWSEASLEDLRRAFPANGLVVMPSIGTGEPAGFCLTRPAAGRNPERCCFNWFGRPAAPPPPPPPPIVFVTRGQLLTARIDSGRPRCRWHRVTVDADAPDGTAIEIAVATADTADAIAQGQPDPAWPGFASGVPHPLDWQTTAARDFLIMQPPGRYLYVRVRLSGDGTATPTVRSLRLDFPRSTSLDALPAVYREEPRAEDFSERFLALFDAALEDLDGAVERFPALFDASDTPEDVLPWLARFLGASFDPQWDAARRRRILAALPALYEQRGTRAGLASAVRLVFDADPVIEEAAGTAMWGGVAASGHRSALDARVGGTRLFSRARTRFRLGASSLSMAPLRSYGDPALDPLASGAYRFSVFLPTGDAAAAGRLQRLVDSQKPAHTVASVHVGARRPIIAGALRVGIDTYLGAPPAPVLGARGTVRLGRDAILRGRSRAAVVVGHTSVMPSAC